MHMNYISVLTNLKGMPHPFSKVPTGAGLYGETVLAGEDTPP